MGKQLYETINTLSIFQAAHELELSPQLIEGIIGSMIEKEPSRKELLTNLSNWRAGTITEDVEFFPKNFTLENEAMNAAPHDLATNPEELVRILDVIIASLRMRSVNSQDRLRKGPPQK